MKLGLYSVKHKNNEKYWTKYVRLLKNKIQSIYTQYTPLITQEGVANKTNHKKNKLSASHCLPS